VAGVQGTVDGRDTCLPLSLSQLPGLCPAPAHKHLPAAKERRELPADALSLGQVTSFPSAATAFHPRWRHTEQDQQVRGTQACADTKTGRAALVSN